ncbi:hypothetical protein [Flavobacterium sp. ALD4]|uniref:hypothetical protein n=1 Tax=Flavobacterium sp. ALD4 TaxID=2058314 RepID=UPI0012FE979E|nr:hypothetical protein [Flavobacterium sp. ALD4]
MKAFEEIKKLRENVSQIRTLFNVKIPKWEESRKTYDKTGYSFNSDDRFSAFGKIEIWFSSWMGTYGDSGCSDQLRLDKDIFKKHFVSYLNLNRKEIMFAIADSIEKEAKSLKEKAEEEVKSQLSELAELDDVG